MAKALYPGSFDPITLGHLDIITRSSERFEHLYVGVIDNQNKNSLFTLEERKQLIEEAVKDMPNVSVVTFDGLSVSCAKQVGATALVRGLRAISDFEYELQLASTNKRIDANIETMFLMANTDYSYVSSSLVKELASYHADISFYVPNHVARALDVKMKDEVK